MALHNLYSSEVIKRMTKTRRTESGWVCSMHGEKRKRPTIKDFKGKREFVGRSLFVGSTIKVYGPGVDSASNRNEYQESFLGE
jgi:hypothetical protein